METSVNNKCKGFTSLEQSRKLAEILPIESADMRYGYIAPYDYSDRMYDGGYDEIPYPKDFLIKNSKKVSIWKHWKDGICGNGGGKQIYLIKMGNTYSLSSCLCFECDYIELSELDNLLFEKQDEQKPTIWSEEDEQSKNWILEYLHDGLRKTDEQFKGQFKTAIVWLERQKPVDKEELKKGALKYVARQFMKWLDAKIPNDKMCLSNMECKDIEDAFLKDDWARISHYMRKKLEKQNKTLDPDKVIEWINNQACLGFIEDIEVEKFVEQFKKDCGL